MLKNTSVFNFVGNGIRIGMYAANYKFEIKQTKLFFNNLQNKLTISLIKQILVSFK